MSPYKPGKQIEDVKTQYGLSRIVKLASNENPFGFSNKVKEELGQWMSQLEVYPDGYSTELRMALADKLKVEPDQLVFGAGSDEVIEIICNSYLYPGTNTIMATPTFPQYKHNAVIEGADIKEVPLKNGYHDVKKMVENIDEQTKILWLCSPNNPTGCHINKEEFEYVMKTCPSDVLVVFDEAYYEYVDTEDYPNTVEALKQYDNLIVLRTFSKAYGLAGLRVGYGVANEEITRALNVTRGPFNTTSFSQKAAVIALQDETFLQETFLNNKSNKQSFISFLQGEGLAFDDSQTNFVFVHLPTTGDEAFEYLLSKGFIVRSGEALGRPNGIRITIGKKEDMEELQSRLQEFLSLKKEKKID